MKKKLEKVRADFIETYAVAIKDLSKIEKINQVTKGYAHIKRIHTECEGMISEAVKIAMSTKKIYMVHAQLEKVKLFRCIWNSAYSFYYENKKT